MITLENLLWLRDTPIGRVNEVITYAAKDMRPEQIESFLDKLWTNVMIMRHL